MSLNIMINTSITAVTSFLNKFIDTYRALYIGRDIFEALAIWFGHHRGLDRYDIRQSYYNALYRPLWRLDTLTFPIRYYLARWKSLNEWIDYSKSITKPFSIKKDEDEGFEDSKINIDLNHDGDANGIIFPMEVWEIIANIGKLNNSILMSINISFFYTFAPKIYDTLKLTIVLTPLTKMKLTDESFLKNGPDIANNRYNDSYSIYERHEESRSFDYESLDTSIDDQDYFKGVDPKDRYKHKHPRFKFKSGLRGERSNQPFEVRNLKNIRFILKNILQNPHSIMKMFIKEIMVDVCVFDGFNELMTMKRSSLINGSTSGVESLEKLIDQEIEKKEHVSVMKVNPIDHESNWRLYVAPLDDNFDRVRWKDSLIDKATRFFKIAKSIKTNCTHDSIETDLYDLFPHTVYFKELLSVYLLSLSTLFKYIKKTIE
ncbi:hypothetical protein BN7_266 [Wickerhamomyces ciferrii]|uniref:Uncharacterized protein n=1 Tax=Wickerhamomyces ciferrii (strain ATCC 14091 / BCRC 22168 / CBS 111 / JCM 3599 / NBRC 0793 / NRRL Y-1031 F-60-10) TaxID=1206466 RepID=K0KEU0_WICCF|nr:uncharacterized protein BN7_266 [Wickerhamomyces ciferrii]CCH40732.1 hypothetical protein BN7_266 [Wickerhamomyces ciferrii]